MADKYAANIAMEFVSVADAGELRSAIESVVAGGLTTVGDVYSVAVSDETGACAVNAVLRFNKKTVRDNLAATAKKSVGRIKTGSRGHIAVHMCRHDSANLGYDSCGDLESEEWGEIP